VSPERTSIEPFRDDVDEPFLDRDLDLDARVAQRETWAAPGR